MTAGRLSVWEMAAAKLEGTLRLAKDAATPGELAAILDPQTVQTSALELIDQRLVEASKPYGRLMVALAPQEGKSTRCAMYFPLWLLMRNPDLRIAIASYESTIARRWGRAIRNLIITHPELGLKVKGDTAAAHEWALDGKHPKDAKGYEAPHRGGLITAGLDAAITGRPVDVLVIDDPVKDRPQAESQVYRDRAWDWWTDAARPRFGPGAIVVVVQTRWHEDDLTGRLQVRDADTWTVLNIPTQADHRPEKDETDPLGREPGEYMISARGDRMPDWLAQQQSPSTWAALYQGKPAPAEGTLLKRQHWVYYDTPKAIRQPDGSMLALGADEVIQSWDCAFKDTKASDYVVCQVWGRWGNDAYLLDQVHERLSFTGTVDAVRRVSKEWPQARLKLVEDKANGTAVIDHLKREVTGLVPVQVKDGKYARAVAVSPFIESRHAFIPSENLARWVQGFVDECATFPNSTNDDRVDAMTQALDRLLGHPVKVSIRRPPQASLPSGIGAAMGGQVLGSRGYGR